MSDETEELRSALIYWRRRAMAADRSKHRERMLKGAVVDEIVEAVREAVRDLPAPKVYDPARPKPDRGSIRRAVNALYSDQHYGLIVDPAEVPGNVYDHETAMGRTQQYADILADYKTDHREESRVLVHDVGDSIHGSLHGYRELDLPAQFYQALKCKIAFYRSLVEAYPSVDVIVEEGNHDRDILVNPGRATAQKYRGWNKAMGRILETYFETVPRIRFHIAKTPYFLYNILGHQGVSTHGDTVFGKGGTPSKNVKTAPLVTELQNLQIAQMALPDFVRSERIRVLAMGHYHTPLVLHLPWGCYLAVNGALSGGDPFAQSIGQHASQPSQLLWETTEKHPVGDLRVVELDI